MKRRDFLATVAASGALSVLDPAYLAAKEALAAGKSAEKPVPRRQYGRHEDQLSIIGFGGITVSAVTPDEAASFVAEAFDRGINYFDVAPTYGNAQERLCPALNPYREKCFLACKTTQREAAGAAKELEESLRLLQTDHVDLYQLHALTTVAEVEKVFGPGGAMETYEKAKKDGKVRYIGFSAHSEEAAHAALDRFDFDSILFPLSFPSWLKAKFGPSVHKRANEAGKGVLALKAMAHQTWPTDTKKTGRRWKKAWYEPFDDIDKVALALRFTLHLPVTAMIPPGHWELVKIAAELAQSGALTPLNDNERKIIGEIAEKSDPIFPKHA
jgi:predicted aldo/keto reductase-like oxidoreductase